MKQDAAFTRCSSPYVAGVHQVNVKRRFVFALPGKYDVLGLVSSGWRLDIIVFMKLAFLFGNCICVVALVVR
jgi:hypothetical protein